MKKIVGAVGIELLGRFGSSAEVNATSANLTRLYFDGVRQVHGTFH
jgi:hypothetical protein